MIKPNKANRLKRQIYTQGRQSKANEMNKTIDVVEGNDTKYKIPKERLSTL